MREENGRGGRREGCLSAALWHSLVPAEELPGRLLLPRPLQPPAAVVVLEGVVYGELERPELTIAAEEETRLLEQEPDQRLSCDPVLGWVLKSLREQKWYQWVP